MKVRITVGNVQLMVTDLQLTRAQVRRLLMDVAGIAAATADEPAPEPNPVGFSVITERAGDMPPEAYFTDDEE